MNNMIFRWLLVISALFSLSAALVVSLSNCLTQPSYAFSTLQAKSQRINSAKIYYSVKHSTSKPLSFWLPKQSTNLLSLNLLLAVLFLTFFQNQTTITESLKRQFRRVTFGLMRYLSSQPRLSHSF